MLFLKEMELFYVMFLIFVSYLVNMVIRKKKVSLKEDIALGNVIKADIFNILLLWGFLLLFTEI